MRIDIKLCVWFIFHILCCIFWNDKVHELVVKILWGYFVHLFYNPLTIPCLWISKTKLYKNFNRQRLIHLCMFYLYNSISLRSSSHQDWLHKYHYYIFIQFPHTDLFYHFLYITPCVSQIELTLALFSHFQSKNP